MTRTELIGRMAAQAGISREQARAALAAFTDAVAQGLSRGETVRLTGFGAFLPADRPAGMARDPRNGAIVARAASRTARFRPGEGLKSVLNG